MKKIAIDFVPSNTWRMVWTAVLGVCLLLACTAYWYFLAQQRAIEAVQAELVHLRAEELKNSRVPLVSDARAANAEQLSRAVLRDWNKVFSTIENLDEPAVRLRSLTINGVSGSIRVEYEMESSNRASTIGERLNAGYEDRPWRLEGVHNQRNLLKAGVVSASWVADVESL